MPEHAPRALHHAQKAVELEPFNHDRWHTLGVAHCRMGQWKEALAAIEKSRQIQKAPGPPDSYDRFFEAMACHQLGERAKARRYYDEAVQWLHKHPEAYRDLHPFRAEAARVLGIP